MALVLFIIFLFWLVVHVQPNLIKALNFIFWHKSMSRQSAFKFQNGNRHERACLSDVHKILIIIFIFYKRKKRIRKKNNSFYVYTYILYISIPSKYSAILFFDVIKRNSIFLVNLWILYTSTSTYCAVNWSWLCV